MTKNLFCFGLGYSAQYLIQYLRYDDPLWRFSGSSRNLPESPLPQCETHIFDGTQPMITATKILRDVTHMLISIPPQDSIGDPVLHHHGADIAKLKNLKWVGYLSTTGIYGNRDGAWVNDETLPAPTSAKGHERREAELAWLKLCQDHDIPVHIFRLGSIYGPKKGPLSNLLAERIKKNVKKGQYFSRIHVADIAQVLMASIASPNAGQSYNVVDDLPAALPVVLDYICNLLGHAPLPPIEVNDRDMSPMMKMFYSENKRVRNERIKDELGVTLKYPTYKEGFKELVQKFL